MAWTASTSRRCTAHRKTADVASTADGTEPPIVREAPSVCPLDCPDSCTLSVTIQDDTITKVRGSKVNPYTSGSICSKVSNYFIDQVHGPHRLHEPLKRVGARGSGDYVPISWQEALDLTYTGFTQAIERYGPQSVLPFNYAGPHGALAMGSMDRRFFHRLGASMVERKTLCGGTRATAYRSTFGVAPGMPAEQLDVSDLIVVWGYNVSVSGLHLMRGLKVARRAGATIVVIDPRRTKVAEMADLHLAVQPGSDVVLAYALCAELERRGMLNRAFIETWVEGAEPFLQEARRYSVDEALDQCGITSEAFHQFLNLYGHAKCAAMTVGVGIERTRNGCSSIRAAYGLHALLGHFGRRGAGVVNSQSLSAPTTTDLLQRTDLIPEGTRTVDILDVPEMILNQDASPPIAALMIYNHNPVCTHPDQAKMIRALQHEDVFVAGSDIVMTDSMGMCDVIFPAASHFEYDDVYLGYGHSYLFRAEPVIPCVGSSVPNTELFRRLARRFGFEDDCFSDTDEDLMNQAYDGSDPRMKQTEASELSSDGYIEMRTPTGEELILCDTVVPQTPSGKICLQDDALQEKAKAGVPQYQTVPQGYPFVLITPSSDQRNNSTFGGHPASSGMERLEMNPEDAAQYQLSDGDEVCVSNDLGSVTLRLEVTDRVRRGVVMSPKGTWRSTSASGLTVNGLISVQSRTDVMRGAAYNDTFVQVQSA